jgi:hypothetical protein
VGRNLLKDEKRKEKVGGGVAKYITFYGVEREICSDFGGSQALTAGPSSVPAVIRTKHLTNTSLEFYLLHQPRR